jgi:hypothetical protein
VWFQRDNNVAASPFLLFSWARPFRAGLFSCLLSPPCGWGGGLGKRPPIRGGAHGRAIIVARHGCVADLVDRASDALRSRREWTCHRHRSCGNRSPPDRSSKRRLRRVRGTTWGVGLAPLADGDCWDPISCRRRGGPRPPTSTRFTLPWICRPSGRGAGRGQPCVGRGVYVQGGGVTSDT